MRASRDFFSTSSFSPIQGFLLPTDSLSYSPDWRCDLCRSVLAHAVIDEVVSTIEKQVCVNGKKARVFIVSVS